MRARTWLLLALAAARPAAAQTPATVPALVEQLAGTDIYLRIGTDQGVATGDTLTVVTPQGRLLGHLVVVGVASSRSVATFVGAPFPVTRGTSLAIVPPRRARPDAPAPAPPTMATGPIRPRPSLHGRVALEANGLQSTARWNDGVPEAERRRFAEPTASVRLALTDLPGGLSAHTNLRAVYRYSSPDLITPRQAVTVYQASVAEGTPTAPFYLEMGRSYNPFVTAGGYWDGAVLRVGGRGFGVGAAAGFEPDRGDQGFSDRLPKVGAFVNYQLGSGPARYAGDLSWHQARPRDSLPIHTYLGWSQYLRVGRSRVSQDLQVDRDPERGGWVVTRLNGSASVPLARGLDLLARVTRAEPYAYWRATALFPFRRDQGTLGLAFWSPALTASADVTAHRSSGGPWGWTYGGSFGIPRTVLAGVGWSVAGSYWTQSASTGLHLATGLSRGVGRALGRMGYQYDRWTGNGTALVTHAADVSLSLPLAPGLFADLRARVQRGANLATDQLAFGIWMAF